MTELVQLNTKDKPNWCPGCGDYAMLQALKRAIVELGIERHNVCIVSGIGCSSKLPQWIDTYGIHTLHGRSLPIATGVKLCNQDLTVIADGGDGDGYGIGMGHFVHAMRRNIDMTYFVHNNQIYGLTQGQASPTTDLQQKTKSTPSGVIENPINPLALAIATNCTFVARGYAGDIQHLTSLVVAGVKHKGFALIDVMQPCVTFNKINTYEYFAARIYKLDPTTHDSRDKMKALDKATEHERDESKIPIGIFYNVDKPTYGEQLPQTNGVPLVKHEIDKVEIGSLFEEKY